jgi:hypothetical protein
LTAATAASTQRRRRRCRCRFRRHRHHSPPAMYWTRGSAWAFALAAFAALGSLVATWACDFERWWLWGYAGIALGVTFAFLLCFAFLRLPSNGSQPMGGAGQIIFTILLWLHVALNVLYVLAIFGVLGTAFKKIHEGTCRNWLVAFPCLDTAALVLLFVIFVLDMQAASRNSLPAYTRVPSTPEGGGTVVATTPSTSKVRARNFVFEQPQ